MLSEKVLAYIRRRGLMKAGDRVGAAVSGGADSVALLHLLLELRQELGVVLCALHFNHKMRGAESDEDECFVARLAKAHGLELLAGCGDALRHAEQKRMGLEAAARALRYGWFREVLEGGRLNCIATAHTLDDQAETVLLRLMRGAGTRGMASIYPLHSGEKQATGSRPRTASVVRPLLEVRRAEVEEYLRGLGQEWREDASNQELRFVRNRVRHQLLPLLERDYRPGLAHVLADAAEVSRVEEEYWAEQVRQVLPQVFSRAERGGRRSPRPASSGSLRLEPLAGHPLALQRRLLRAAAESLGLRLDFQQVRELLRLAFEREAGGRMAGRSHDLPGGWRARRGLDQLHLERFPARMERAAKRGNRGYEYRLLVPGEVRVEEIGSIIRASLRPLPQEASEYNRAQFLDPRKLAAELIVRNWRPGDRYWPAHGKGPKKVKDLLQEGRVARPERNTWPVVTSGEALVWVRGLQLPQPYLAGPAAPHGVVIEEVALAG